MSGIINESLEFLSTFSVAARYHIWEDCCSDSCCLIIQFPLLFRLGVVKVRVACGVNRSRHMVSFLQHSVLLTRNFSAHKGFQDISNGPSVGEQHKHTFTHTPSLKPPWLNFQLLIPSVFPPCTNDIFLRLFHKSRHKPPANLSYAQRGPCHILADDRQRRVLQ